MGLRFADARIYAYAHVGDVGSRDSAQRQDDAGALSLFARPGDGSIKTRHVAILVADGVDNIAQDIHARLTKLGAVPRFVAARLGTLRTADGEPLEVEVSLETTPSVLYDAVVVPGGREAVQQLANVGHALEFLKDQYRHCKPMFAVGRRRT